MQVKSNHTFDKNCHCDSNTDFLANSYFIVQIHHAKSFKMNYIRSLYLNFLLRYSERHLIKVWFDSTCIRCYVNKGYDLQNPYFFKVLLSIYFNKLPLQQELLCLAIPLSAEVCQHPQIWPGKTTQMIDTHQNLLVILNATN